MTRGVPSSVALGVLLAGVTGLPACGPMEEPLSDAPTTGPPATVPADVVETTSTMRVVVVLDASRNLSTSERELLSRELAQAVQSLNEAASFNVIAYGADSTTSLFRTGLGPANADNKRRAASFLDQLIPGGAADPIPALRAALESSPQLVFLVAAGPLDAPAGEVLAAVEESNRDKASVINTIQFRDRDEVTSHTLQTLAEHNGGTFRRVGGSDLQ